MISLGVEQYPCSYAPQEMKFAAWLDQITSDSLASPFLTMLDKHLLLEQIGALQVTHGQTLVQQAGPCESAGLLEGIVQNIRVQTITGCLGVTQTVQLTWLIQQGCWYLPVTQMLSSQKKEKMSQRFSKTQMKTLWSKMRLCRSRMLKSTMGMSTMKNKMRQKEQVTPTTTLSTQVMSRGISSVLNLSIFFMSITDPLSSSVTTCDLITSCWKFCALSGLAACGLSSYLSLPTSIWPEITRMPVTIATRKTAKNQMKTVPRWTLVNWDKLACEGTHRFTQDQTVAINSTCYAYEIQTDYAYNQVYIYISKLPFYCNSIAASLPTTNINCPFGSQPNCLVWLGSLVWPLKQFKWQQSLQPNIIEISTSPSEARQCNPKNKTVLTKSINLAKAPTGSSTRQSTLNHTASPARTSSSRSRRSDSRARRRASPARPSERYPSSNNQTTPTSCSSNKSSTPTRSCCSCSSTSNTTSRSSWGSSTRRRAWTPCSSNFCYQLLQGINYCHEKKILHRDLKPQNLLISKDHILKIADFGLARASGIPTKGFTHEVVTLWYRPPDVLLGSQKYSNNIDIWSVGCIFAEMCNMKPLFPGQKEQDELIRIFKVVGTPTNETWPGHEDMPQWKSHEFEQYPAKNLGEVVPKLDELGLDLLNKMLQSNPYNRITAKDALIHPYFKDIPEELASLYKK